MENQEFVEPGLQVDHDFLNTVETEIERTLARVSALEAGLVEFSSDPNSRWEDACDRMSANLAGWERRLDELSRNTAETESALGGLESNFRGWFHQLLGMTKSRLADTSSPEMIA